MPGSGTGILSDYAGLNPGCQRSAIVFFALPRDFHGQVWPSTVSYIYISSFGLFAKNP